MSKPVWHVFGKFFSVGLLNTLVDFLLFFSLSGLGINTLFAQCVGYSGGMVNSFFLNKSWTFQHNVKSNQSLIIKFVCVNLLTLLLTSWGISFLESMQVNLFLSKVIVTVVGTGINFIGMRTFVFPARIKEIEMHEKR